MVEAGTSPMLVSVSSVHEDLRFGSCRVEELVGFSLVTLMVSLLMRSPTLGLIWLTHSSL